MFLAIFVGFLELERGRDDVVLNGLSLDGRKTEASGHLCCCSYIGVLILDSTITQRLDASSTVWVELPYSTACFLFHS